MGNQVSSEQLKTMVNSQVNRIKGNSRPSAPATAAAANNNSNNNNNNNSSSGGARRNNNNNNNNNNRNNRNKTRNNNIIREALRYLFLLIDLKCNDDINLFAIIIRMHNKRL